MTEDEKNADKLIEGLIWLEDGGREAAHKLQKRMDETSYDTDRLEEGLAWLGDIFDHELA